jgi:hypothetical protein
MFRHWIEYKIKLPIMIWWNRIHCRIKGVCEYCYEQHCMCAEIDMQVDMIREREWEERLYETERHKETTGS